MLTLKLFFKRIDAFLNRKIILKTIWNLNHTSKRKLKSFQGPSLGENRHSILRFVFKLALFKKDWQSNTF